MADKVKPLKIESPSTGGTQVDPFPVETNPAQDYLASKGIAFENNDNRLIDLDGSGNIQFKDVTETIAVTVRQLRTALNNIFSNSGNGFTATNVQDAIIEAKDTAVGKARFAMVFAHNGTVGNNTWLGFNELVPSNTTPLIVPVDCKLSELAMSFAGANVDGVLLIYKNGTSNPANVIYSNTFTNQNTSKLMTGLNLSLVAGDQLRAQWQDTGDNPNDAALQWFFQAT